jgi:hypothetical protein
MSSIEEFKSRLSGEFAQAHGRVEAMQKAAEERHQLLRVRSQQFLRATHRVKELLWPRIEAFESFFRGVHKTVSKLDFGPRTGGFRGAFVAFTFPHTEECPAAIKLRFGLEHDDSIEHLILTYDLEMVPVFVQFQKHDEIRQPVDRLDEPALVDWFDRVSLGFTKSYLDIQFDPRYQEGSLVIDPVLDVSFPRFFAAGKLEQGGTTHHFFTEDSLREYQRDPSRYAPPAARSTPPRGAG